MDYIRIYIKLFPDGRIEAYPLFEDLDEQERYVNQARSLTEVLSKNKERLCLEPDIKVMAGGRS